MLPICFMASRKISPAEHCPDFCPNFSPAWFTGPWRDWHRGHGCCHDDGCSRSAEAATEISQHAANKATGYLTDAELSHLRARTTSGDELLVRALDELRGRRAEALPQQPVPIPRFGLDGGDQVCSRCGLDWPDAAETLEPHACPPGFLDDNRTGDAAP